MSVCLSVTMNGEIIFSKLNQLPLALKWISKLIVFLQYLLFDFHLDTISISCRHNNFPRLYFFRPEGYDFNFVAFRRYGRRFPTSCPVALSLSVCGRDFSFNINHVNIQIAESVVRQSCVIWSRFVNTWNMTYFSYFYKAMTIEGKCENVISKHFTTNSCDLSTLISLLSLIIFNC